MFIDGLNPLIPRIASTSLRVLNSILTTDSGTFDVYSSAYGDSIMAAVTTQVICGNSLAIDANFQKLYLAQYGVVDGYMQKAQVLPNFLRPLFLAAVDKNHSAVAAALLPVVRERRGKEYAPADRVLLDPLIKILGTDDMQIALRLIGYLYAAFVNSANLASLTTSLVAAHPELHDKLRAEAAELMRKYGNICPEQVVTEAPLADACVREAVRLGGAVVGNVRVVKREFTCLGKTVPVGEILMMSTYWTQHNPAYYKDPEQFIPQRWLAPDAASLPLWTFGAGAHICRGRMLAPTEAKILLLQLLYSFDIELVNKPLPPISWVEPNIAKIQGKSVEIRYKRRK